MHDESFSRGGAAAFLSAGVTSVKQYGHASYNSSGLRWRYKVLRGFVKTFPQAAFGQVKTLPFCMFSSVWEIVSPPLRTAFGYKLIVLMQPKYIFRLFN